MFLLAFVIGSTSLNIVARMLSFPQDENREKTLWHYALMGLNEDTVGQYSFEDDDYTNSFETKEEKVEGETAPKSAVVGTSNVTNSPKTGDDTLIQIFASILLMSAIGSVYILYKKKMYKTKPESTKEE
jgi:LPXTG-motif cell wall-anchored protein